MEAETDAPGRAGSVVVARARKPVRVVPVLLVLAVMASACRTSGNGGSPAPSPTATSPSPTGSGQPQQMVVAVQHLFDQLVTLYRVREDGVAEELRTIKAPRGYGQFTSITMSDDVDPLTCVAVVANSGETGDRTRCYPLEDPGGGYDLPLHGYRLAVSPDGTKLLSLGGVPNLEPLRVTLSRLDGRTSSPVARVSAEGLREPCPRVRSLAWAGDQQVVVDCRALDRDQNEHFRPPVVQTLASLLARQPLATGRPLRPSGALAEGYQWYESVSPVDERTAVALMTVDTRCLRGDRCAAKPLPSKLVRIDLRTGGVLEVVASSSARSDGYFITGMGAGARGIFYYLGTDSASKRVYVRWPGAQRSTRVTGLPPRFYEAYAQS